MAILRFSVPTSFRCAVRCSGVSAKDSTLGGARPPAARTMPDHADRREWYPRCGGWAGPRGGCRTTGTRATTRRRRVRRNKREGANGTDSYPAPNICLGKKRGDPHPVAAIVPCLHSAVPASVSHGHVAVPRVHARTFASRRLRRLTRYGAGVLLARLRLNSWPVSKRHVHCVVLGRHAPGGLSSTALPHRHVTGRPAARHKTSPGR